MIVDKEGNIDFGEVKLPTSWEELTLKQFSDIQRFYADKESNFNVIECLSILTNLSQDDINSLPMEFTEKILVNLKWLSEPPKYGESTPSLVIDGVRYTVNVQEKLKTGEYIAVDTLLKDDKYNYAALLAILCRKEGEIYDSKYENEVLPSRIAFWEKQPMLECMRIASFFLNLWLIFGQRTQLSSQVMEALDLEREHILSLRKSGALSILSTKCAMRKLRKLEKSIKSI
jgi:hypothetical protein